MSPAAELWRLDVGGLDSYESLAARLSRVLSAAEDATMDSAATTSLEEICAYAEVDRAFVAVLDERERVVEQWTWDEAGRPFVIAPVGSRLDELSGSVAAFVRIGRTLAVGDMRRLELSYAERTFMGAHGGIPQAGMMLPVMMGADVAGLLGLYAMDETRDWTRQLVAEMESIAELVVRMLGRNHARHALAAANARARRIADHLPDGLLMLTTEGVITWVSPSFEQMVGRPAEQLEDRRLIELVAPDDRDGLDAALSATRVRHDASTAVRLPGRGGQLRWADLSLHLASDRELGVPDEIVITVRDGHERHLREMRLVAASDRDALTGVANRGAFDRYVRQLTESDEPVLVAFCDVDDFKSCNDERGHGAGDEALRRVARLIEGAVRQRDMVARFGGDEFVVVVVDPGTEAAALGERLVRAARAAGPEPLTLSIGVCGPAPAGRIREMIALADEAMYSAKRAGKDGWVNMPPLP